MKAAGGGALQAAESNDPDPIPRICHSHTEDARQAIARLLKTESALTCNVF